MRTVVLGAFLCCAMTTVAQVTMNIDAKKRGPMISPYQYGLFFEEINHAGDGGLYAELIRNRSFEDDITFTSTTVPEYWSALFGAKLQLTTTGLLNGVQEKCAVMTTTTTGTPLQGIANAGYWGMKFVTDSTYTLSFWAKGSNDGYTGNIIARLQSADGKTLCGEATVEGEVKVDEWTHLTATIKATASADKGRFVLLTSNAGQLYLDVVSLFPYTWKGRKNGMRPDLAQLLADTKPTFLRFPGGCFVEGTNGFDNAFQWKKTIGPIEMRNGHQNVNWGYRSSDGLGYDEYLQFCEDLGAAPMFVVNVGLGHGYTIPMADLDTLVQNTLDAIEYANGDVTTYWGAIRAANGHPAPYGIKFVEIGNENYQANAAQQSQDYAERYYMFYKAIKEKYPDIITIGNVEAWGTDNPTWRNDYPVELVDEHYYRSNTWMRSNYHKYDGYSRAIGVYNGEYAANETGTYGTYGNMNSALGEAVYMLGMEKNSDVCRMASFAPIFMHESDPRWPYDMIHFNCAKNFVTPSYYVQQLLPSSLGKQNLLWTETGNTEARTTKIGIGSWLTSADFDDVVVTDGSGATLISDDFSTNSGWTNGTGTWSVTGGVKRQTSTQTNCTSINNTEITASSYTLSLRAQKRSGAEGFLVIFYYKDANNYAWWNIGGWNNKQHGIELCQNGVKSTLTTAAGTINNNVWYDLRVNVEGQTVTCYMNDQLVHTTTLPSEQALYQSVQIDEDNGELLLKVVNPTKNAQTLNLNLSNMTATSGTVVRLAAVSGTVENTMSAPNRVSPQEEQTLTSVETLDIPAFSLNVFRLKVTDVAAEEKSEDAQVYEQEDADKYGYLYAHMSSAGEITCYALSRYGQIWTDLLGGAEVFDTKKYTTTGGMRDAYIFRMQNGKFMLAGTDMTSRLGWESNHIMDFMISNNLVHWDKAIKIDLESAENMEALGLTNVDDMQAAWAPQVIYDPVTEKYMAYYSVGFPDRHRIYYQLLDEDLNVLTKPQLLFDPGYDVIDADIVWNAVDQQYVMVYKWEGKFHLYQATAKQLVPTDKTTGTCQWTIVPGFDIYESGQGIEAASLFRPIGSKNWKLAWMNYGGSRGYKFVDLDEHCLNPQNKQLIQGDVNAQHGSFLKLTEREYNHLKTWEAVMNLLPSARSSYKASGSEVIKEALDKAERALNESGSFDEEEQAMKEALVALQSTAEAYRNYLIEQVRNGEAVNLTPLLVNADFSAGSTGWQGTAFSTANGQVAEQFNKTFDFYQVLTDMPAGQYEYTVQAFYRDGAKATAYANYGTSSQQQNAEMYVEGVFSKPVVSLYSEPDYTGDPYTFPDNMAQAEEAFNRYGQYVNRQLFMFPGGDMRLGIRSKKMVSTDWTCFDNFQIRFTGITQGIEGVKEGSMEGREDGCVYDLQGRQVSPLAPRSSHLDNLPKGVYILNGKKMIR
ncbi:MAG: carbohydrate binding domain-containing protein [Prevotella sp.]|nr:carbohydrate binding domain-containing protein [Prevotella sp.]